MNQHSYSPEQSELGKKTEYDSQYSPNKLYPITRKSKRDEIGIAGALPFFGYDLWNHYEVSWLNENGKPIVALAEISYDCETPLIIESKSLKLYFNSFNNTKFKNANVVSTTVKQDLEERINGKVTVTITPLADVREDKLHNHFVGENIDELDVACSVYSVDPTLLKTDNEQVSETLHTNLLRSNCLITNQPDWGSIQITYKGKKINREALLRYIVSFRNHNEFHEQCVERIFVDIMKYCQPEELTVYGRYTRRGGLDINALRTTDKNKCNIENMRLCRQ
jgi:7-cyano-7-deazaguanine reductase